MATSVKAWVAMCDEFLTELTVTFPERKKLKRTKAKFDLMKRTTPSMCLDEFMELVAPYKEQIMSKDESVVTSEGLREYSLHKIWTPDLSQGTKDAIWQHLQSLLMLGSTIKNIPSDFMETLENVAQSQAENIKDGGQLDFGAIFGIASKLASEMEKNNSLQ